jgi:hypothetical protein
MQEGTSLQWQRPTSSETRLARFEQGTLLYQGVSVRELLLDLSRHSPSFLQSLASFLTKLSQRRCCPDDEGDFWEELSLQVSEEELAVWSQWAEAACAKIAQYLSRAYQRANSGIHCVVDNQGQLLMNGVNITAMLRRWSQSPDESLKDYVRGIYYRLQRATHRDLLHADTQLRQRVEMTLQQFRNLGFDQPEDDEK